MKTCNANLNDAFRVMAVECSGNVIISNDVSVGAEFVLAAMKQAIRLAREREPSLAILDAGEDAWRKHNPGDPYTKEMQDIYRAMMKQAIAELE